MEAIKKYGPFWLDSSINLNCGDGKDKAVFGKEVAETLLSRREGCLVFCEFFSVTIFWSVLRQNNEMALFYLFLSWPQSGLVWCWCSVKLFMWKRRKAWSGCWIQSSSWWHWDLAASVRAVPRFQGQTIIFFFKEMEVWNQETCYSTSVSPHTGSVIMVKMTYSLSLHFPTWYLPQRNMVSIKWDKASRMLSRFL